MVYKEREEKRQERRFYEKEVQCLKSGSSMFMVQRRQAGTGEQAYRGMEIEMSPTCPMVGGLETAERTHPVKEQYHRKPGSVCRQAAEAAVKCSVLMCVQAGENSATLNEPPMNRKLEEEAKAGIVSCVHAQEMKNEIGSSMEREEEEKKKQEEEECLCIMCAFL